MKSGSDLSRESGEAHKPDETTEQNEWRVQTVIGIVLPTRGLVFTRVESAIERIRGKHSIKVYRSDNLPIPLGHASLVEEALSEGVTHIWMIEEDNPPLLDALDKLLAANADIACIDYGVNGWGCVTRNPQGEILWCGLGCTLIKREVFEKVPKPWFRVDKTLRLNDWTWQDLPEEYIKTKQYGSLDIWFFTQARKNGFSITQVEGEVDHLELINLGKRGTNNGLHEIGLRPKIEKKQILSEGGELN